MDREEKRCEAERAWFFREAKKSEAERQREIFSPGKSLCLFVRFMLSWENHLTLFSFLFN
jgi:hypothetical protein